MSTYIVSVEMHIVADDVDDATGYAKETLNNVRERDLDGPGAAGDTSEPWLIGVAVDNRAEECK